MLLNLNCAERKNHISMHHSQVFTLINSRHVKTGWWPQETQNCISRPQGIEQSSCSFSLCMLGEKFSAAIADPILAVEFPSLTLLNTTPTRRNRKGREAGLISHIHCQ